MLKLKLEYFGHMIQKAKSLEKTLMLKKAWRQEKKGTTEDKVVGWSHGLMDMSLSKLREMVKDRKAWCAAVHGVAKGLTQLSN